MSLSYVISNAEISPNPATGRVTGDDDPTSTQEGTVTKLALCHDDLKADQETTAALLDDHDHDPGGANPGGPPIGTDGEESIAAGAITDDLIADGAVTGAHIAAGAVGTSEIDDNTVDLDKLGAAGAAYLTVASGGSATWTKPASGYMIYHIEAVNGSGDLDPETEALSSYQTSTTIVVSHAGTSSISVAIRYLPG